MSYVDEAEKKIRILYQDKRNKITTSQIRGLLSGMSDIYNDVVQSPNEILSPEIVSRIQYLRVQFIYECGRDEKVRKFLAETGMINKLDAVGNSKKNFIEAERYMEALVAYHKFNKGADL